MYLSFTSGTFIDGDDPKGVSREGKRGGKFLGTWKSVKIVE